MGPNQTIMRVLRSSYCVEANPDVPTLITCSICTDITANKLDGPIRYSFHGPDHEKLKTVFDVIYVQYLNNFAPAKLAQAAINFSDREREVLRGIAQGLTSKTLADKLSLSVHTVRKHRANVLNKAGANNTAELVRLAKQHGWLA